MTAPTLHIAELHIYPVKGCRGIALSTAAVEARGLRHDRRWMVVRANTGGFLSQRSHPEMARICVQVADNGTLTFATDGGDFTLPFAPDSELRRRAVSVWSFHGDALDCGDDAAAFFGDVLRLPVRLVRVPDDFARRVNPKYAVTEGDGTGFADGFPVLLVSDASLTDLNARLAVPVPMDRFRPNVVVSGAMRAWEEDEWREVAIGGIRFHNVKPCDRCAVPTIDQHTGAKTGAEPIATLATFRRDEASGKVLFGINLIPGVGAGGRIVRVGDPVRVE